MLDLPGLHFRARLIRAVREFFHARDYLEVETPVRLPVLIPEAEIEPVASGSWWLQTSPEQCMKRLLARGAERIFQICPCFRAGEQGRLHNPEFTLLEWYHVGWDYRDLMRECEALFLFLHERCRDLPAPVAGPGLKRMGRVISLAPPWPRMSVAEAFRRWGGMEVSEALARGCFDEIMVERLEPRFGWDQPLFLYDYPAPLASLARKRGDDPSLAERFELYAGGLELANGFSELVDTQQQRQRFVRELERIGGRWPAALPEKFLADLETIPDCAGIALGIDRLVLLFLGASDLDRVLPFSREDI